LESAEEFGKLYQSWLELVRRSFFVPFSGLTPGPSYGGPSASAVTEARDAPQAAAVPDWQRGLDRLLNNAFNLPPASMIGGIVGPASKAFQESLELAKIQADYYRRSGVLWNRLMTAWTDGTLKATEKLLAREIQPGEDVTKVRYGVWVAELERSVDRVLNDEGFAKELGALVSSYLDLRKKSNEILDAYYRQINIPTRGELESVYRELHSLRREVDRLRTVTDDHRRSVEGSKGANDPQ
jgi:hypothetical protein